MELPETRARLPRVEYLPEVGSTNAAMRDLADTARGAGRELPHGTLVVTGNQTAGRGRQGRDWVTPPDTALATSFLVRGLLPGPGGEPVALGATGRGHDFPEDPHDPADLPLGASWLPLIAGSAVVAALKPFYRSPAGDSNEPLDPGTPAKRVGTKWPNDVHVRDEDDAVAGRVGPKLAGILCEVLADGSIIVGTGINVLMHEWELPTERATSLLASGGAVGEAERLTDAAGQQVADRVLAAYANELLRLVDLAREDPKQVRARVLRDSLTLGSEVRVHMPDGTIVDGRAAGLDGDGALIVDRPTTGQLVVNAADIEHLR